MKKSIISFIWSISVVFYLISSTTFCAGSLVRINSISLYLFLGTSILGILCKKKNNLLANGYLWTLIIYGIIILVSLLYTPALPHERKDVIDTLYDYVTMVIIVACIMEYMDSIEKINLVLFSIMISGVSLSIYVYLIYGSSFWGILQENAYVNESNISRIGSELTNENVIGICVSYALCIAIYFVLTLKKRFICILVAGIAVLCFIMAMATGSKKTIQIIVTVFVAMSFFFVGKTKRVKNMIIIPLFLVIVLSAIYYIVMTFDVFSGIRTRMTSQLTYMSTGIGTVSNSHRDELITKGLQYWMDSPLFGNGFCATVHYFGVYSHSNFVEILMNSGIVGFVVFYVIYVSSFRKFVRILRCPEESNPLYAILFGIACSLTLCGYSVVYYYDRYLMILFAVVYKGIYLWKLNNEANDDTLTVPRSINSQI